VTVDLVDQVDVRFSEGFEPGAVLRSLELWSTSSRKSAKQKRRVFAHSRVLTPACEILSLE